MSMLVQKAQASAKTIGDAAEAGFTLIELMIVIAIIGILAAIAVPQYVAYVHTSEATTAAQDFHQVVTQATAAQSMAQAGVTKTTLDPNSGKAMPGTDGAVITVSPTGTSNPPKAITITLTAPKSASVQKDLDGMLNTQTGTTGFTGGAGTATISATGAVTYNGKSTSTTTTTSGT